MRIDSAFKRAGLAFTIFVALTFVNNSAHADDPPPINQHVQDLTHLQIEDLMKIKVTSASKKEQPFSSIPAAVFVITQEDIRRSGALTIPDLLRMVPGVQVAQIDANKWAITVRGFNGHYANKLLVLVDGRSVYTPLFAGVFWDRQDLVLEDIDRIEVVRGPGGSVWGANAVNGVINIITKHAKDTQGVLFSAGAGNEEIGFGTLRYGGTTGKNDYFRLYGKYFAQDALVTSANVRGADQYEGMRGGFRMDWDKTRSGSFMLQGDIYRQLTGDTWSLPLTAPPYVSPIQGNFPQSGWNLLGRWEHEQSNGNKLSAQVFYDRTLLTIPTLHDIHDTFDIELQKQMSPWKGHSMLVGLGYRRIAADATNSATVMFLPAQKVDDVYSGFIHDEFPIRKDIQLTLGAKLEHNPYTGLEFQPNARVTWTPGPKRTVWGAISRAARTPSRLDTGAVVNYPGGAGPGGISIIGTYTGNPNLQSETVLAYEAGYRAEINDRLIVDAAAFYNVYDDLILRLQSGAPFHSAVPPPMHLVAPLSAFNVEHAETYGIELASRWRVAKKVTLSTSYSLMKSWTSAPIGTSSDVNSPDHQFSIRSQCELAKNLEFDGALYWVNRIGDLGVADYTRLDLRLAWRPTRQCELSVVGRNLLSLRHAEFGTFDLLTPNQVERSVYGKATWRF